MNRLSCTVVFACLLAFCLPAASFAGVIPCSNCYETTITTDDGPWFDALCCDPDSYWDCPNLIFRGFSLVERFVGCNYRMIPQGTRCDGDSNCDDYWGGDPSGACVIPVGDLCPAECDRCQTQP